MPRLFEKVFFASLAWAGLAASAQAIHVVESGDFPNFSGFGPGSFSVGALELGINSIEGELDGECTVDDCGDPSLGDSVDSFRAIVPPGTVISSIIVNTNHVIGPDGFTATIYGRSPTVQTVIPPTFVVLEGTSGNLLVQPIAEGEYSLNVYGQSSEEPGPFSLAWTMYIEVEEEGVLFADGFESGDTADWSFVVGH